MEEITTAKETDPLVTAASTPKEPPQNNETNDTKNEEVSDSQELQTEAELLAQLPELTQKNYALAYTLKQSGDDLIKANKLDDALKEYTKAVLAAKHLIKENEVPPSLMLKLKSDVLVLANLNMSYIDLKKNDYTNAVRHCNKVLFVDKSHVKARYRRCKAYIHLGEFKKADEDLFELEDVIGGSNELEELEEEYESNKRRAEGKDNEFYKRMAKNFKKESDMKDRKDPTTVKGKKVGAVNVFFSRVKKIFCCCCKKKKEYDEDDLFKFD